MQSEYNEDRKTFSQKKKEEKTYEKENDVYFVMYILCLSAVVTVCTFKAFAASYHEPIQVESPTINVDADSELQAQQYVDFKFKGLKNSQHIILVKGGGYLLNEEGSDVDKSDL